MLKRLFIAAAFVALSASAFAQPFNPTATVSLSVSNSSARVALPIAPGGSAKVCNQGSNAAFVKFGDSTVTSSATDNTALVTPVIAGACEWLATNGGTNLAAITSSSTTSLLISVGSGQPSGFGGGSGGGGGGGSVTQGTVPWVEALALTATTGTGWTSATAANATQTIFSANGPPAVVVQLDQTSTISAGAVTFEGTFDGTNWVPIPPAQVINPNTFAPLTNPYTLVASTNQPFLILTQGYQSVRIRLSTQITGTATVTPFVALLNYNPTLGALLNPLVAGSAIIGKVGIDPANNGISGNVNVAPTDCSVSVTTGGTAQNIITAGAALHGFTIMDIDTGKTEGIWVSFTGTAAVNTGGSYFIPPYSATAGAGSYTSPLGAGYNGNVSLFATTTGHKVSCTKW